MPQRACHILLVALCFTAQSSSARVFQIGDNTAAVQVVGEDVRLKTRYEDTLYDLARLYDVGSEEIIRANPGVDPWLPGEGTAVVIPGRRILPPGPRAGIVINVPEHTLYYYPRYADRRPRVVLVYPVSIGKSDWMTPLGETRVVEKIRHPSWYPPASIRAEHRRDGTPLPEVVGPGSHNPLGDFALRLGIAPGDYLIHGTNNPLAVGLPITHGCIRMYPEDIRELFPLVPLGTKVYLVNDPVNVAHVQDRLLLEVHPPIDPGAHDNAAQIAQVRLFLAAALGGTTSMAIDWVDAIHSASLADGFAKTVGHALRLDAPTSQDTLARPTGGS